MFILYPDAPMRGLAASRLIDKTNVRQTRSQRIEDQLSILAAPKFDDIGLHIFVLIMPDANWNFHPGDKDLVCLLVPLRAKNLSARPVGGDGQFCNARIDHRQAFDIALNVQKTGFDPTWNLIFDQHPVPVCGIYATNKFDVGSFTERKEV